MGGGMTVANIPDQQKLWESCLNYMSLRVKKHSFNTWFKYTRGIYDSDASSIVINVPNQFVADWLSDRYADLISEAIRETSGKSIDFLFEISHPSEFEPQTEIDFNPRRPEPAEIPAHARLDYPLNERFRFDNFVVGKFNQFGHAAAVAVAEAPGTTPYNPLFIYGGTGLGKTHLIQAIGHYVQEQFPRKKIVYATSEKFTSDFIYAVSNGKINDFTSLYRSADILLVDDVQFFSGKESTQEQFFHTFNDLSHSGKQVVLTSDRHPRDIKGLEERLLSRFSSGLVADLQPPDLESRIAILRKRTDHEKVVIPEDVLYFIADNVNSNVRELEGCLTKLLAYASLEKTDIDRQFAERALGKEIIRPRREISITEIQKKSAEFFQIDAAMMTAKKKTSRIALARQVAMYLSRKLTAFSLKSIGEAFGGRDHSTVIHACDSIAKKMENDYDFREKVTSLEAALLC
ncbi:MAG: chromosomal replication initiator protein DnaA [Candidatus Zixiibacteriota bacterium]|nr:MAG: chromosomal replication initiator protein DnaA [candidate division Zixibacteria bacterium]